MGFRIHERGGACSFSPLFWMSPSVWRDNATVNIPPTLSPRSWPATWWLKTETSSVQIVRGTSDETGRGKADEDDGGTHNATRWSSVPVTSKRERAMDTGRKESPAIEEDGDEEGEHAHVRADTFGKEVEPHCLVGDSILTLNGRICFRNEEEPILWWSDLCSAYVKEYIFVLWSHTLLMSFFKE